MNFSLAKAEFVELPVFGLKVPTAVEGVPSDMLTPKKTYDGMIVISVAILISWERRWLDPTAYDEAETKLARMFLGNFSKWVLVMLCFQTFYAV